MKISKKSITVICLVILMISGLTVPAKAYTLQASSSSKPVGQDVKSMWNDIKAMETGTLGLESQNASDGLDCHMSKNSEYGAALLLTISAYGAGSTECYGTGKTNSSTGNASGIYQLSGNYEWCAAYYTGYKSSNDYAEFLKNLDNKYVDRYTVDSLDAYNALDADSRIKGDALFADGFLGSTGANWVNDGSPVFLRGNSNVGFFSCGRSTGSNSNYGRAVVVCGSGL